MLEFNTQKFLISHLFFQHLISIDLKHLWCKHCIFSKLLFYISLSPFLTLFVLPPVMQICIQWLGQCFWNYLDWPEICHYVATCIIMGPDYQVYTCISALRHLQQDILQHTQTQDLQVFLKVKIYDFLILNPNQYGFLWNTKEIITWKFTLLVSI